MIHILLIVLASIGGAALLLAVATVTLVWVAINDPEAAFDHRERVDGIRDNE